MADKAIARVELTQDELKLLHGLMTERSYTLALADMMIPLASKIYSFIQEEPKKAETPPTDLTTATTVPKTEKKDKVVN